LIKPKATSDFPLIIIPLMTSKPSLQIARVGLWIGKRWENKHHGKEKRYVRYAKSNNSYEKK